MSATEIQTEPLVTDDLAPYEGAWVAVRDGRIVASALTPVELRDDPQVQDTDALIPVPRAADATFIL
ncbi:hypothetical protein [Conexibacter sp. S30A1]|uniref:hypothetical protein n=1 Tax=Conexibacter sp. S30A1 TaxID=2937800 RepID=UPI00200E5BD5|nr:hypothetical protein [Conexibacter sp. S30A1]